MTLGDYVWSQLRILNACDMYTFLSFLDIFQSMLLELLQFCLLNAPSAYHFHCLSCKNSITQKTINVFFKLYWFHYGNFLIMPSLSTPFIVSSLFLAFFTSLYCNLSVLLSFPILFHYFKPFFLLSPKLSL